MQFLHFMHHLIAIRIAHLENTRYSGTTSFFQVTPIGTVGWCDLWHPLFKRVPKDSTVHNQFQATTDHDVWRPWISLNVCSAQIQLQSQRETWGKNPINKRSSLILSSFSPGVIESKAHAEIKEVYPSMSGFSDLQLISIGDFQCFHRGQKITQKKHNVRFLRGWCLLSMSL